MDQKKNILLQAAEQDVGVKLQKNSPWAIASFVFGNTVLLGLLAGNLHPYIAYFFLTFPVAVVSGHIGRKRIRKNPEQWKGEGMATYGMVLGYLGFGLTVFLVIMMMRGFNPSI
jgi:hypothetical protein